jgi:hypothetical protein
MIMVRVIVRITVWIIFSAGCMRYFLCLRGQPWSVAEPREGPAGAGTRGALGAGVLDNAAGRNPFRRHQ